ncbi:MAG: hypothetical protein HZB39_00455 [Planctomycetes bacterium]|nr:hypothetical protein [Planctomycetota bacterium]
MSAAPAWLSTLVVLLAAGMATQPATGDGSASPGACRRGVAAADCADCHAPIAEEWAHSAHARAFTEPRWLAALATLDRPERCHGCHAPEPVQGRLGRPPAARQERRDAGVDCAACHVNRSGIAGPFGSAAEGHQPDADPLFTSANAVNLCASCHDTRIGPVLPLVRDWRASSFATKGHGCIRCHMPREERAIAFEPSTGAATGPVREGRSHELLGPGDPDFAASAFWIDVARRGTRLELRIRNEAGHRVPGLVGRVFEVELTQQDERGRDAGRDLIVLSADNPLFVDETRRFRAVAAPGGRGARVVVTHAFAGQRTIVARHEFSW